LRRWLKEDEMWKRWLNVEMEWIHHHNPDLVILNEDNTERERIDLRGYSYQGMNDLMKEKGFIQA
jgi:hypothetical protein